MTAGREIRETGHAWLPEIPADWQFVPSKALFANRAQHSRTNDVHLTPSQKYGVVTQDQYMQLAGSKVVLNLTGSDSMKHVEPGDFIIHLRSFQGGLERSPLVGKVSLAYTVLTPRQGVLGRYFEYMLKSDRYIQAIRVVVNQLRDGQSIRHQDFGKVPLPLPPPKEQQAIADFLDRETAKIDALIEKQNELVDLLLARRSAAISTAVRQGINQGVRLRDSGIPWIGPTAAHWALTQMRRIATSTAGAGFPIEEQGLEAERHPFYKVNALGRADADGVIRDRYDTISRDTAARLGASIVPAGTLVMAKIGAALMLGRIRILSYDSCIDNNMLAVTPRAGMFARFLYYALQDLKMDLLVNPGAIPSLSERSFRSYQLPVPPADEQRQIADHLDRATVRIDALIAKAEEFIVLAKERRAALITAAVTGQIDVLGEAS